MRVDFIALTVASFLVAQMSALDRSPRIKRSTHHLDTHAPVVDVPVVCDPVWKVESLLVSKACRSHLRGVTLSQLPAERQDVDLTWSLRSSAVFIPHRLRWSLPERISMKYRAQRHGGIFASLSVL